MKPHDRTVDFNTLLGGINLVVACLIGGALWSKQTNDYVDSMTLGLGLVLCLETHVALMLERTRRDPFMLLLAFTNTLYYALRLFTLWLFDFSFVFDKYAYDARDSNFALLFMLVANLFLYGGLLLAGARPNLNIEAGQRQARFPLGVLAMMLATFALTYVSGRSEANSPRIVNVLVTFLSPPLIVAMTLTYFLFFRHSLSRGFAIATATLLALEIVAHTLFGSRSALVGFVQTFMMVALAINGKIQFRRGWLVAGIVLLPVGMALAIAAFALSTYNRAAKDAGGYSMDLGHALQLADAADVDLSATSTMETLLKPVFARAGFFDFSAEIIAHRDKYAGVINLSSYGKSIVDNILTPGFDVFDQPKIANSLLFVYRDWGMPSKAELEEPGVYESDQIGIYGEFYALFGYSSLPLLFLLTYGIKRLHIRAASPDPYLLAMKRFILLSIFARSIDSFGMDWTIGEVLPLVVATLVYAPLFSSSDPSIRAVSA